jgi:hypothetical protein
MQGLRELPKQALSKLTAMNSELRAPGPYPIGFNSDSLPIGIDTHASRCIANAPHLFEDLRLSNKGIVQGINDGLEIKGKRTIKFKIEDNSRRMHKIKIPNSLYLPGLERCLLLPQHWVQEAGDKHPLPEGTWCKNTATHNILFIESAGVRVPCSIVDTTPKTLVLHIALAPGMPGNYIRHHLNIDCILKHLFGQFPAKLKLWSCQFTRSPSPRLHSVHLCN